MTAAAKAARLDALARELHLTRRQRLYAEGLVSGLSGLESARRAGYNGGDKGRSTRVAELVRNSRVQRYMTALAEAAEAPLAKRSWGVVLGRRAVLRRLSAQADADFGAHLERDESGALKVNDLLVNTGFQLDPTRTRSLRGIEIVETTRPGADGAPPVVERRIKVRVGADSAAVQAGLGLADIYGMRQGGGSPPADGELQARLDRMRTIQANPEAVAALERLAAAIARPVN